MKRALMALLGLLAAGAFAAWDLGLVPADLVAKITGGSPAAPPVVGKTALEPTPPTVTVVGANVRTLEERVLVTGTLVARTDVLVAPEVEGLRVVALEADIGDRVAAGQVLARLERETLEVQLAQRDAGIARSRAAIAQARSAIVQAEAREVEAKNALDRGQSLKGSGFLSDSLLDQRQSAARAAEAALVSARDGLTSAEADLVLAEAQRRDVVWRLGKTEIRAPAAGIVSNRNARIGGVATAIGDPMFRIIAAGEIELEAEVPEVDIIRLKAGQTASVEVAGGAKTTGTVRLVSPEVDRLTRLGRVRIALGTEGGLRVGSFGRGTVITQRKDTLAVPIAAVQFGNRGASVQRIAGDQVDTRPVQTGLKAGDFIEIRDGLSDGDRVVARAGTFLRHGDRITAVESPSTVTEIR